MNPNRDIRILGIPDSIPETIAAVFRSRLITAVNKFLDQTNLENIKIIIGTASDLQNTNGENYLSTESENNKENPDNYLSSEKRASRYKSGRPIFDFEQLVVPGEVKEDLLLAVDLIELEPQVFDTWGLRKIEPFPRTALNFYGKPGTGKTLAAHAIASKTSSSCPLT